MPKLNGEGARTQDPPNPLASFLSKMEAPLQILKYWDKPPIRAGADRHGIGPSTVGRFCLGVACKKKMVSRDGRLNFVMNRVGVAPFQEVCYNVRCQL